MNNMMMMTMRRADNKLTPCCIQHQTQQQQCWRVRRIRISLASFFVFLLALSSSLLSVSSACPELDGGGGGGGGNCSGSAAAMPVFGTDPAARRGGHVHCVTAPLLLASSSTYSTVSRNVRVALAGGIAGAVGTAVLYPVDTAKT